MARASKTSRTIPAAECLTVRIPQAAQLLGIGRSTFYKLMQAGEVETIKLGRSTLIPVASIEALLAKRRQGGPQ